MYVEPDLVPELHLWVRQSCFKPSVSGHVLWLLHVHEQSTYSTVRLHGHTGGCL